MVYNIVFGDSFINYLSLIKTFKVFKFSGKTLKGFSKDDSTIRKTTLKEINKKKYADNVIFGFGNVDLHLSFYYDVFTKPEYKELKNVKDITKLWEENTEENIKKYIMNINKIRVGRNSKKIVMGVFPSTLKEKNVIASTKKYIQIDYEKLDISQQMLYKKLIKHKERHHRFMFYNKILKRECDLKKIKYIDVNEIVLTKTNKIKKKFIDISDLNIHLSWEPLLIESKKMKIFNDMGINDENTKDLEKTHADYLEIKKKILNNIEYGNPDHKALKNKLIREHFQNKKK